MPHEVIKAKEHDRQRSLGWLAIRWIEHFCIRGPGDVQGRPLSLRYGTEALPLTDELAMLKVDCYALDTKGHRLYDSAFYSRPKGADKSGDASFVGCFEALGPCRFAGWAEGPKVFSWGTSKGEVFEWMDFRHEYEPGEPMGRPITYPFLRILATEEGQTGHVYDSIYYNLREGPLRWAFPRLDDVGLTRVYLPEGGEIRPTTAASASKDGGKETWINFDETHLYTTLELHRMYDTVRRNLAKRKEAEPWSYETSTMYEPGKRSVAELSHNMAKMIRDHKVRLARHFFDHREAPANTDLRDEASLCRGLKEAYGDAFSYMPIDRIISEIWDPRNDVTDSRRYFLNQVTAAGSSWIAPQEWDVCAAPDKKVLPGEEITIGLDPSDTDDHTVLMACRVSDSHLFPLGIWDPADHDGKVPMDNVDNVVESAFATYDVVGFYSDRHPAESYNDKWNEKHREELCVKATFKHAISFDMRSASQATPAIEAYHTAIVERDLTHSGDPRISQYHYNARRRPNSQGISFGKDNDESKIDGAASAMLARKARQDYLALPENKKRRRRTGKAMFA